MYKLTMGEINAGIGAIISLDVYGIAVHTGIYEGMKCSLPAFATKG
jgi:hypothetical protein